MEAWQQLNWSGDRRAYRLPSAPHARGGQADVFKAIHKATGATVAFKRSSSSGDDSRARFRRELEIGYKLAACDHIAPVIDGDPDDGWLVMPWADGTLDDHADHLRRNDDALRTMVESVCDGLAAAHDEGWLHRDVKPSNILWLSRDGRHRWVLADWGLVRRPRGETTHDDRTRSGVEFGTEGYAPPEAFDDAHEMTDAGDIWRFGSERGVSV